MGGIKSKLALVIAIAVCLTACPAVSAEPETTAAVEIHVSPDGAVNASGTANDPVPSLEAARKKAAEQAGGTRPINVTFHEGEYRFDSTVKFTEADSGTAEAPITYKAAEGEKVVFKGSRLLDVTKLKKVDDKGILKRLPENSRDKVGYIDLKEQGIEKLYAFKPDVMRDQISETDKEIQGEDVSIFLDNSEQTKSEWPNGFANFAKFEPVTAGGNGYNSINAAGGSFRYFDENPSRWTGAKDAYLGGFFSYDYSYNRVLMGNIDTENKVIELKYGAAFGVVSKQSRRWKVFNLLEEIDTPGEWYVDKDSLVLYYYPPYGLKNAKLEIATLRDNMIKLDGADYIRFEGITFSQTCSNAIYATNDADNIEIVNCTFRDIGGSAVYMKPTQSSPFADERESTYGAGDNWRAEGNVFFNIGATALVMSGGRADTMESGGPVVRNNYVNQCASKNLIKRQFLEITGGNGAVVEHNVSHNTSQGSLIYYGINHKIRYNEFGNAVRDCVDAGDVYGGRSSVFRGNEIAYNYIHDFDPVSEELKPYIHNRGIYWDDALAGQTAHHNIIRGGDKAISVHGSGNKVNDNIVIDSGNGIHLETWKNGNKALGERYDKLLGSNDEFVKKVLPGFIKAFPDWYTEATQKDNTQLINMVIRDNVSINSKNSLGTALLDRVENENNVTLAEFDGFVNVDAQDYRIKKDSTLLSTHSGLPSEESFDINQIGIETDGIDKGRIEKQPFRKLYPENGACDVDEDETEFIWERAQGADKYRFVIAADALFENVLEDMTVEGNCFTYTLPETETGIYYWKVYAVNTMRQLAGEWESSGSAFMFKTRKAQQTNSEALDFSLIDDAIETLQYTSENLKEGNDVGEFPVGTSKQIDEKLAWIEKVLAARSRIRTNIKIQNIVDKALSVIDKSVIRAGFYNISNVIDKDSWYIRDGSGAEFGNNSITLGVRDSKAPYIATNKNALASKKTLMSFGVRYTFGEGDWFGIALRGQDIGKEIWSDQNYAFIIKKDIIELQAYTKGRRGVLKTFENTMLDSGKWHDVSVGVIDCVYGQMIVLIVDGKTVVEEIDSAEDQIRADGCFKLYLSNLAQHNLEIAPYSDFDRIKKLNNEADSFIEQLSEDGVKQLCAEIEKIAGTSTVVAAGCDVYYDKGTLRHMGKTGVISIDGKLYISQDAAALLFGTDHAVRGEELELKDGGVTITAKVGSRQYTVNGVVRDETAVCVQKDTQYYIPLYLAAEAFSVSNSEYNGMSVLSGGTGIIAVNNIELWGAVENAIRTLSEK